MDLKEVKGRRKEETISGSLSKHWIVVVVVVATRWEKECASIPWSTPR